MLKWSFKFPITLINRKTEDARNTIVYPYTDRDPYDIECNYERLILIVPNNQLKLKMINNVSQLFIVFVWCIAAVVFTFLRKIFQLILESTQMNILENYFINLGVLIGTTSTTPSNTSERILLLFMAIFSMLSSLLFSGFLFQQLAISDSVANINSIEELEKSNLHLFVYEDNFELVNETIGYVFTHKKTVNR